MTHERETHNARQRDYFEKTHKKTMQPRKSAYIDRHVERIIEAGRLTHRDRILDVGCGIGKYTLNLAARGYQVEGLDLAPGLLEQLKAHNQTERSVPVYAADIAFPPEELERKFDVIIGFFALHHMLDLEGSFRGMAKLLKQGGRLLFIEPNPYNILYYFQILLTPKMTWEGDKGILKMRPNILFPAMKRAGFSNLKVDRCGFFPPFLADRKGMLTVEKVLEQVPFWRPCLPFQIFTANLFSTKELTL